VLVWGSRVELVRNKLLFTFERYTSVSCCQAPRGTILSWMSVRMATLRLLGPDDLAQAISVYRDAVISQAGGLYSERQIEAWAEHARRDEGFRATVLRGYGLASPDPSDPRIIEAFAVLDPEDRLALLYCRGRSGRQGRGTILLRAIEARACEGGCSRLRTEASQLSRPLLEREGWAVEAEEEVIFAGTLFRRWRMIKDLV
jgi:putative acetyltransferase